MQKLVVFGKASGKVQIEIKLSSNELNKPLMDLLMDYEIPVASSCAGQGKCLKCITSSRIASCQILVKEYIAQHGTKIEFDYL